MPSPLTVHEFGDANAHTLMLLHPGAVLHSIWLPFIRIWSQHYHILAPDLIQNGPEPLSLQNLATQVIVALGQKKESPVWLIGASLGANVGLLVTVQAPHLVTGLILDSAQVGGRPPALLPGLIRLMKGLVRVVPQSIMTALLMRQFGNYASSDRSALRAELETLGKSSFLEQIEAHFAYDVRSSLTNITVPTLIIAGEQDMLTKSGEPYKLKEGIPSATVKVVPQAGHVTFLRQPAFFTQLVTEFVQGESSRNS